MNDRNDRLTQAMDSVRATEELKSKTRAFVAAKAPGAQAARQKHFTAALAVCGVFLAAFIVLGFCLYTSPVSAISIDVNPSVELEMNWFGRVLSCRAYNDGGAGIAKEVNVKNMPYADAVKIILQDREFQNYIKDDSCIVITVAGGRVEEIAGVLSGVPAVERLSATVETTEMKVVSEAHDCGFSFGKYKAYLELKALDGSVTEEEAKTMTMHELRNRIAALGGSVNSGCQADGAGCGAGGSPGNSGRGHGKNGRHG